MESTLIKPGPPLLHVCPLLLRNPFRTPNYCAAQRPNSPVWCTIVSCELTCVRTVAQLPLQPTHSNFAATSWIMVHLNRRFVNNHFTEIAMSSLACRSSVVHASPRAHLFGQQSEFKQSVFVRWSPHSQHIGVFLILPLSVGLPGGVGLSAKKPGHAISQPQLNSATGTAIMCTSRMVPCYRARKFTRSRPASRCWTFKCGATHKGSGSASWIVVTQRSTCKIYADQLRVI
jgi:hypothetical protein